MTRRLRDRYDTLIVDLDGTLYRGTQAVEGAAQALTAGDQRVVYATNNAGRRAAIVAAQLRELGFAAQESDVLTSAQVGAQMLAQRLDPGASVLVVGPEALAEEVREVGLSPVRSAREGPAAVIQGYSPAATYSMLAEASYAICAGALWLATNLDANLPTERGLAPGNGAMVAALRTTTGREPLVAGKPYPALFQQAVDGSRRALVIGDRLDTDIEGANRAGLDSLLVLTGVSTREEAVRADADQRPTYVAERLDALNQAVD
jgi:HAD superfamily hydrolase (TIGR01450 family)